jgi:DNA gyrase subunit A
MAIRFKEDDVRPMGLIAAGVNGMKLDNGDEVIGAEILPSEGEVFLLTSDGKAKRVVEKDFPAQGRYGKGVIAWELADKVKLAGVVTGKSTSMATIHLSKGAPKSTRLDAVSVRKRAATKGDVVVEVKPGEEAVSVNVGWTVERFVEASSEEKPKKKLAKASSAQASASKGSKKVAAKKATKAKAPTRKAKPVKKTTKSKTPTKKKSAAKAKPAKKTASSKRKRR